MNSFAKPSLLAVVFLVASLVGSACQPAGFYDTSNTDIPSAPGDIARSYVFQLDFTEDDDGNLVAGQNGHVVIYRSTSAIGEPNLVSGTVVLPVDPWTGDGDRPIVAMAPGTQGMADSCAPSITMASGGFGETDQVNALVAKGFAVAITDYEGLGTSGDHSYSVADSQAHAVLDVARAARNLGLNGLSADSPVALWGYSQGGSSVARAAEIEQDYAPDLGVKTVVGGGAVANPYRQSEWVTVELGTGFAGAALMSILGFAAAYPELDAGGALTTEGADLAAQVNELCALEAIFLVAGTDLATLVDQSVLDSPEWRSRLDEQIIGTVAPRIPTFLYHGASDFVVPADQGYQLRDGWCGAGASVRFEEYEAGHFLTNYAATPVVVDWLSSAFEGTETPRSDC